MAAGSTRLSLEPRPIGWFLRKFLTFFAGRETIFAVMLSRAPQRDFATSTRNVSNSRFSPASGKCHRLPPSRRDDLSLPRRVATSGLSQERQWAAARSRRPSHSGDKLSRPWQQSQSRQAPSSSVAATTLISLSVWTSELAVQGIPDGLLRADWLAREHP